MFRTMMFGFMMAVAVSFGAFALTGSGDSGIGPLETVPPTLDSVTAVSESSLEVTFSEAMLAPGVTAPGNYAVSGLGACALDAHPTVVTGTGPYTLTWASGEMYATSVAVTATGLQDALGNPIDPAGNRASGMGIGEAAPLYAWPLTLVLLVAGLFVLAWRRDRACALLLLVMMALIVAPAAFAQAPTVSNVTFSQGPNSTGGSKVDITYDLVTPNYPCDIIVSLSKDGGTDGFIHPVTSVTGDLTGVTNGTGHHIEWDIAADYPREDIPQARIRVTADDGSGGPGLPVEMVSVPAGTFNMGRTSAGDDETDGWWIELPVHAVTLGAYQIGKGEVTNQQYCDVLNWALAQGYLLTDAGAVWTGTGDIYAGGASARYLIVVITQTDCCIQYSGGVFSSKTRLGLPGSTNYPMDRHPVVLVSWYGSVAFCNWLSQWQGLTPCYDMTTADWPLTVAPPAPGGYRLPTEAEWERAAAWDGSKHWIYGFTSDTLTGKNRANYSDYAPDYVNPLGLTAPYTSPDAWFNGVHVSPNGSVTTVNSVSPVGCYDMSGNVSEWCHDWHKDAYYSGGAMTNPTGPASSASLARVVRGGSCGSGFPFCRSAMRYDWPPAYADYDIGFRLARS